MLATRGRSTGSNLAATGRKTSGPALGPSDITFQPSNLPTFQPSLQLHHSPLQPPVLSGQDFLGHPVGRHVVVPPQSLELRVHAGARLAAEQVGDLHRPSARGGVLVEQPL